MLGKILLKRHKQLRRRKRRTTFLSKKALRLWSISLLVPSLFYGSLMVNVTMGRTFDEPTLNVVASPSPSSLLSTSPSPTVVIQKQKPNSTCFYAEAELCARPIETENGCKECMVHPTIANSLICCNVTDIDKSISCVQNPTADDPSYWAQIHIYNATLEELDISNRIWTRLDSLAITDGQVKRITKEFLKFSAPKCLNISNNGVLSITPHGFDYLTRLEVLDISNNNLSTMPDLNSIQTNLTLDIRGNAGMLCKSVLELIERGTVNFLDVEATFCLINQTFHWFNTTDMMPLRQLERIKQLNSECPRIPNVGNCTCEPEQMGYNDGQLVFAAKVDCSNMGLTELPKVLPMMTISLNISNNSITSLKPFNDNPSYRNLMRVYADDNKITSLLELEASKFIHSFAQFHLRRNELRTIPMYILSNSLDKIPDGRLLYLEGNKLYCDCNSAKTLKVWLIARRSHLPDYEDIACENMPQHVHQLSETRLCQSPHDWTDYIYYLITLEVLLLIACIMKVTYDWTIFRSAGYLPWPANKMPKLPCDYLCE